MTPCLHFLLNKLNQSQIRKPTDRNNLRIPDGGRSFLPSQLLFNTDFETLPGVCAILASESRKGSTCFGSICVHFAMATTSVRGSRLWPTPEECGMKGSSIKEMEDATLKEQRLLLATEAELETAFSTEQALAAQLAAAETKAQTSLTEASQMSKEALEKLSLSEERREAVAGHLSSAVEQVERRIADAEAKAEEACASLLSRHEASQREADEDLKSFKGEMESRAQAAEELISAMQDERSLMICGGLSALRGEALEARLNMSRQRMTEACAAHEAAEKREAMAKMAYREALSAEEEAASEAVSEAKQQSRVQKQRASLEIERIKTEAEAAKAEADAAEELAKGEAKTLSRDAEQKCLALTKQAEKWNADASQGMRGAAERLRGAEVAAAQIWRDSEEQIAKAVRQSECEMKAALDSCREGEAAAEAKGLRLKDELCDQLHQIQKEETSSENAWAKAMGTIQAQKQRNEEDETQRIFAAEHLGGCLLSEELAVQEEAVAFEIVEEEAASRLEAELEAHLKEAAMQNHQLAEGNEEALRPLTEALQHAKDRASKVCKAAEEAEALFNQEAAAYLRTAELRESHLQERSLTLQEELLLAKQRAQQRTSEEEATAQAIEEDARCSAEQQNRACWEEVAATHVEAAQMMKTIHEEEERLSTRAQELLDESARMEVSTRKMQEAELTEEIAAREVRTAVKEVEVALQKVQQECEHEEAAVRVRGRLEEIEMCEVEAHRRDLAEIRWQSAEWHAEEASLRCNEAIEAAASLKTEYRKELEDIQKRSEKKESEAMAKLLAAEKALATSLQWCVRQNQIGVNVLTAEQVAGVNVGDVEKSPHSPML
ncbi:unnamed protein product [Durusdinium trenchii]|uniref:Uncharacterized protein n=1 Tax=Durusdinium trenchii TaxID=1381693 RepID=A0ABP0SX62_9DINO